jgi:outer membrane protein assembly factor BamE (lipoprotein component of BamABCDE complex)
MSRVLDVSKIKDSLAQKNMPVEFRDAINARTVREGMTYQMVLMSMGEPDQKKVDESSDVGLHETWFYLKEGHRWVVKFDNGKVGKYQVF